MAARNVLWAQCSLHVWASVSSSRSVGSRPSDLEVVADHPQFRRIERQRTRPVDVGERVVIEAAHRDHFGATRRRVDLGWGQVDDAVRPPFDDRVGDQTVDEFVDRRVVDVVVELDPPGAPGVVDVDADGGGGVEDRVDVAVGDAGERGHLDGTAGRDRPAAVLQERVDEHRLEFLQGGVVQIAVDEHHVGDVDTADGRQPEVGGADDERLDPGVGIDRTDGQSIPRGHWRDPTE